MAAIKPGRYLLRLLWQQPLWSIPFALYFGTIFGDPPESYIAAYKMALVFAYTIGFSLWALDIFAYRRHRPDDPKRLQLPVWAEALSYVAVSILASYAAGVIIHFWIMPGFVSGPRTLVLLGAFAVLFAVLVTGLVYAYQFYRKSLDQARSEQELVMARRIQRSFLLSQFPSTPRLEIHAMNVSSREVSGDFYDVVPVTGDGVLVAIADVAGKGVPAALMSSMLQASLRTQANTVPSMAAILGNINTLVYRSSTVHQFATFFVARIHEPTLSLSYCNAGHNPPVLFRANGDRVELTAGGTVVGILETLQYQEATVPLQLGDRIVLYTDGITEAAAKSGELFGEERLYQLVEGLPTETSAQLTAERIVESARGFQGEGEPQDDMTVLVLKVLDPAQRA